MTLLAIPALANLLPLLFVLACALVMVFMIRGMHGGHGRDGHGGEGKTRSLDELKHERDQLNEEIGRRAEESFEARRAKVFG
jgi:Spy/CpxP family protein refolding chaperone